MLNSPSADHVGFSTLFGHAELCQLARREPKLTAKIRSCNDHFRQFDEVLRAYTKLSPEVLLRLVSKMEVDAIMWAFGKKVATRVNHDSIENIMAAIMKDAKALDNKLPDVPRLKGVMRDS